LPEFRRGVRLAVDWGKARVGVAACDVDGLLCYPVETVPARDADQALARIAQLVAQNAAVEVVLGLPLALDGRVRVAAEDVLTIAARLAGCVDVPVRAVDERLTTAAANRQMTNLDTRRRRPIVDQAAAVGILDSALAFERNTGRPPGHLVVALTEGES